MRKFIGLLFLLPVCLLSACQDKNLRYNTLMLHPDTLQRVYNRCVEEVADPTLPCETIMRAQADFTALVILRERDPERFGARILQAEENMVFLRRKYETVLQAYHALGDRKPSLEDLKKMRIDLDKAREQYLDNEEGVKILLAVIAATSMI